MREENVETFVRHLKYVLLERQKRVAFFLGAGCSMPEIPGAGELVRQWLPLLRHERSGADAAHLQRMAEVFRGHDESRPAASYSAVLNGLFWTAEDRQRELDRLTHDKDPGFGYAVLAQLIAHDAYGPQCNLVLTTNFDDMAADALYLYARRKALVLAHDALAGAPSPNSNRPTIIKLPGDALLGNGLPAAAVEYSPELREALQHCLAGRALIFAGYGGNEHAAGEFFRGLPADAFAAGLYWVGNDVPENAFGRWLRTNPHAIWIRHRRFDELMALVRSEFELPHPDDRRFLELMDRYRQTIVDFERKALAEPRSEPRLPAQAEEVAGPAAGFKDWWSVELEARRHVESDPDVAQKIYEQGLRQFPDSAGLMGCCASFLYSVRNRPKQAETLFRRALDIDENDADCLANYAQFLCVARQQMDKADAYYQRAIAAAPKHVHNLANYALFLQNVRQEPDLAELFFRRAIAAGPTDIDTLRNYAVFLIEVRQNLDQADACYRRAIQADPDNSIVLGEYALFLKTVREDMDHADFHYQLAIDADPSNANNLGNYAVFLRDVRQDLNQAEAYYRLAIDADPQHAINLGNYAVFLRDVRQSMDQAEVFFRRAVAADPKQPINLGNYALFLKDIRQDMEGAETFYQKAIDADPANANNLGNYAIFLQDVRRDMDQAEIYYECALEADENHANNLGNYAVFLQDVRQDWDLTERFYLRAIKADPHNPSHLGNYALFLSSVRRDMDQAELYYQRAVDADPSNATNLGNYALFLKSVRGDAEQAEQQYQRAIAADPNQAVILRNYAVLLWHMRRAWDRAEAMLHRALEQGTDDSISRGNLVGVLFAQGKTEAAEQEFERFQQQDNWPQMILEVQFYRYTNGRQVYRYDALSKMKELLVADCRAPGWDFASNIEAAEKHWHPNVELVRALAEVISNGAEIDTLDAFPDWRQSAALPQQA